LALLGLDWRELAGLGVAWGGLAGLGVAWRGSRLSSISLCFVFSIISSTNYIKIFSFTAGKQILF